MDVGTVLAVIDAEGSAKAPANLEGAAEAPATTQSPAGEGTAEAKPEPPGKAAPDKRAGRSTAKARSRGGKGGRLRLSPVVRRVLAEHGVDAQEITGSGRDGRITRDDVLAFVEQRAAAESKPATAEPAPRPAAAKPPAQPPAQPPAEAPAETTRVPFDRIRRVTAEHMVRSKATSAHVMQAVEVDFSGVNRVRLPNRGDWRARQGFSLTYLPFIARAVCLSLHEFPRINSSVDDDGLLLHKAVHLSIAVNLNFEGLVAPVIRGADGLTVAGLARGIHDIGRRAREGDLAPDEYSGGTYTLSNNGSYGTLLTGANHQSAPGRDSLGGRGPQAAGCSGVAGG